MRVAFVGKGGVGKSLIAATVARLLGRRGESVLALDLDPLPGFAHSLGVPAGSGAFPDDLAEQREGQGWVMKEDTAAAELIERYAFRGPDGVRLLSIATRPGEWKAEQSTAVRHVARTFDDPAWSVIGDLPAGTRQAAFGWAGFADLVAIVVEPTAKSVLSARRIATVLADGRPEGRVGVIVSKLRPRDDRDDPERIAASLGLELLGTVPYDEAVRDAEQDARAPIDGAPASTAVRAIRGLLPALEAR
ncbi:MAG TPA: ArsA-related P-loop ATPase [Candidatus Limnocylindria bacterium]